MEKPTKYLDEAIRRKHLEIHGEGRRQEIRYVAINHSERFGDPEEAVRAEFYAELILRYDYPPTRIGVEVILPDRVPNDRADLVIFEDDERKRPFAVIECKRDGVTDAEFRQAVEQAVGNGSVFKLRAKYVGVIAGSTRQFLDFGEAYGILERDANILADLPAAYGKPQEYTFHRGAGRNDLRTADRGELIRIIQKCHQSLWGGGRLSPPTAFGELCKLIFVKISDEQQTKIGAPYQFQIKTHEPAPALSGRIRALYAKARQKDPEVFQDDIRIDDFTLRQVVRHLESVNLNATDLDSKGVAFERFMDGFFKGDFGQYFTPREIIQFCVELLDPQHDETVLDPACGSGGFLLYALDHVRRAASEYHEADTPAHYRHWHDFASKNLFGIEINDEIARVAKMNMIVHDDGHTNVVGADALDRIEDRLVKGNPGLRRDAFDVILTNPPFGAVVRQTERGYLDTFELSRYSAKPTAGSDPDEERSTSTSGRKALKQRDSVKTEILFLERVRDFLKPGTGRAAVVLPDGILTNASLQGVRDWLMRRFEILAVVSLPQTAFYHYGASVKASVMVLRRRAKDEAPHDDEATFMALVENAGYDSTGRKSWREDRVLREEPLMREVIEHCDLYQRRAVYTRDTATDRWIETESVILGDGVLGQFRDFRKLVESSRDSSPFFA